VGAAAAVMAPGASKGETTLRAAAFPSCCGCSTSGDFSATGALRGAAVASAAPTARAIVMVMAAAATSDFHFMSFLLKIPATTNVVTGT
jgi:hypothetical protein